MTGVWYIVYTESFLVLIYYRLFVLKTFLYTSLILVVSLGMKIVLQYNSFSEKVPHRHPPTCSLRAFAAEKDDNAGRSFASLTKVHIVRCASASLRSK